jgi:hypothetical protein
MATEWNGRYFDRISVLISQFIMTEKYYNYWKEIQEQNRRKGIFDSPPFNLQSNLYSENPGLKVYGYFGVVQEKGKRWDFTRTDLSYPVENTWEDACILTVITPFSPCINCLNISDYATTVKPYWWDE